MKEKQIFKKAVVSFLVSFLLMFMLLIFGPAEIFFANVTEFDFVYGEFGGYLAGAALFGVVLFTAVLIFLPDKLYRVLCSVLFGICVAGYLQVMFLNKNLDLLGVNPEGYKAAAGRTVGNLLVWILVIGLVIFLAFWKKEIWKKTVLYLAAFLLCIQLVAFVSLLVTADRSAYEYQEGDYYFSGEDQFKVSANDNIILIILDYYSNCYIEPMEGIYPGSTAFLHDFTYYSNMDCVYYGTFPSLPHMLTGQEVDSAIPINEWTRKIWEEQGTCDFYNMLRENNYTVNLYTPEVPYVCGGNSAKMLEDKITNVVNTAKEIEVNYGLLNKTLEKMVAYRICPEIIKPYFYTNVSEYTKIVTPKQLGMRHQNYEFFAGLNQEGLSLDDTSNYFVVQHLMGPHEYTTDENGLYKENATRDETARGCMVIVEAYLNQLKDLGVYDSSTIIVTADHGDDDESQVIFYIKEPYESHDVSPITNAPVSLCELLPTIAEILGENYQQYGQSIHDFEQGEERERTVWVRKYDEHYPAVLNYTSLKEGKSNVYYGYTYVGDIDDLLNQVKQEPSIQKQMADSFW